MAKILIIEDDPSITKVISARLNKEGYEMMVAGDGEEGLRKVKSEKPDLIILDLMLPRKDGFAVLEEMKIDPEVKSIPVLILSNLGQAKDIDLAMKLGVKDYMIKTDFTLGELVEKVKQNIKV